MAVELRQRIRAELHAVVARLRAAAIRVAAADREAQAAEAALALVRAHHGQGATLLDAERASTEAAIHRVQAIDEQNRAQFDLRRILGLDRPRSP